MHLSAMQREHTRLSGDGYRRLEAIVDDLEGASPGRPIPAEDIARVAVRTLAPSDVRGIVADWLDAQTGGL
jgi:hypothetical protein